MLIPVAVFFATLVLILGGYWAFIVRPETQAEMAVKKRLTSAASGASLAAAVPSLIKRVRPLSTIPLFDKALRGSAGAVGPLQQMITQSGLHMTVGQLVLMTALAFAIVALPIFLFLRNLALALGVGLLFSAVPTLYVRFAGRRRIRRFEEQFPEAIDLMARALRAGHALPTALNLVGQEAPEPVRSEFRLLHDEQNYGMPFPDALRSFGARVPLLDARFFVTAVLTQREAGGNLAEVLDRLAALIRERFKLKRQVRTLSSHGRFTGWVLGLLPFFIGGALFVIAPRHIAQLFTDPIGIRMMLVALVLEIVGVLWIRKVVNIEI
jgi:tight adherence protein B